MSRRSFVSTVDRIEYQLREDFQATDEELDYLRKLYSIKDQAEFINRKPSVYGKPSMIIPDFLYHGDFGDARNEKKLSATGIQHILNMSEVELNENIVQNFNVVWIPINDDLEADLRQIIDQTNEFIESCRKKSEKVLVNCQLGISRSSSVILAYLIAHNNKTLYEAYEYLVQCRPIATPNAGFFLKLIRYEKEIKQTASSSNQNLVQN